MAKVKKHERAEKKRIVFQSIFSGSEARPNPTRPAQKLKYPYSHADPDETKNANVVPKRVPTKKKIPRLGLNTLTRATITAPKTASGKKRRRPMLTNVE